MDHWEWTEFSRLKSLLQIHSTPFHFPKISSISTPYPWSMDSPWIFHSMKTSNFAKWNAEYFLLFRRRRSACRRGAAVLQFIPNCLSPSKKPALWIRQCTAMAGMLVMQLRNHCWSVGVKPVDQNGRAEAKGWAPTTEVDVFPNPQEDKYRTLFCDTDR